MLEIEALPPPRTDPTTKTTIDTRGYVILIWTSADSLFSFDFRDCSNLTFPVFRSAEILGPVLDALTKSEEKYE